MTVRICGLQNLTLLDYPGKVACTVFVGGCNFRCPFCHNASLVLNPEDQPTVDEAEVFELLKKRAGILEGVCVTGGEPLLQPGLDTFLAQLHETGVLVKLDTNGSKPERLGALLGAGLVDYVAMDIKAAPASYPQAVGIPGFDVAPILASVELLMQGSTSFEFRTTVVRELHTEKDFETIADWLAGTPRYFLQGFKDNGELINSGFSANSKDEMERFLQILTPKIRTAALRGID